MQVKFSTSESFAELRQEGAYYADKTEFLVDFLVGSSSKVTLFTRPRRFGKTLFLSMIADFFDST